MGIMLKCKYCGKEIVSTQKNKKYCSQECSEKYRLMRQREGCDHDDLMHHNECAYCHKVFLSERQSRYCSYECSYHDANARRKNELKGGRAERYREIDKIIASYGEHIAPIPGYEKYYATDDGRIFSTHRGYWKEKAQHLNRGYCYTSLANEPMKVHQLVLFAFRKERPANTQTRHLNGNRQDNRLCNLEWGSAKENFKDKREHGTVPTGEKSSMARLSDDAVAEIIRRASAGESMYALAKEYRTSAASICRWKNGKIRKQPTI